MATESDVVVAAQPTGTANIATVVVTRQDGTIVHKQEIVISDADIDGLQIRLTPNGEIPVAAAVLDEILHELRRIRTGMQEMTERDLTIPLP